MYGLSPVNKSARKRDFGLSPINMLHRNINNQWVNRNVSLYASALVSPKRYINNKISECTSPMSATEPLIPTNLSLPHFLLHSISASFICFLRSYLLNNPAQRLLYEQALSRSQRIKAYVAPSELPTRSISQLVLIAQYKTDWKSMWRNY